MAGLIAVGGKGLAGFYLFLLILSDLFVFHLKADR